VVYPVRALLAVGSGGADSSPFRLAAILAVATRRDYDRSCVRANSGIAIPARQAVGSQEKRLINPCGDGCGGKLERIVPRCRLLNQSRFLASG